MRSVLRMGVLLVLAPVLLVACGGGGGGDKPTVRVEVLAVTTVEGAGTLRIQVSRSGSMKEALAVACQITGTISNVAGRDFAEAPIDCPIVIPAKQRSVEIVLTPIEDTIPEDDETLTVTLLTAHPLYDIAGDPSATVTIVDDDPLVADVSVAEAKALFDGHSGDPALIVLDVRTPTEFATGHLLGAVNIDYNAADFAARIATLDPRKLYLVYCMAGGRSANARNTMVGLGFRTIYNMLGGIDAWVAAGYPVTGTP